MRGQEVLDGLMGLTFYLPVPGGGERGKSQGREKGGERKGDSDGVRDKEGKRKRELQRL